MNYYANNASAFIKNIYLVNTVPLLWLPIYPVGFAVVSKQGSKTEYALQYKVKSR